MAVQYRSVSAVETGTGTSVVIDVPAGVVAGDMLIAFIALTPQKEVTPPAGWTEIIGVNLDSAPRVVLGYYKLATGAESADYEWTVAESTDYAGHIIAAYSDTGKTLEIASSYEYHYVPL